MRAATRRALTTSILMALPAGMLSPARAQGIWHKYLMRGQIVEMQDKVATLCVGRADGAQPGQTLTVVRFRSRGGPVKGAPPRIDRQDVGQVRIDAIIDDHFATATVVSGQAAKQDMVELLSR